MIEQNSDFNESALAARRNWLDLGTDNAKVQIYSGTRPAGGGSPTGVLLGEIKFDKPCGVVNAGHLTLTSSEIPLAINSGAATWGRILNGAGTWAFDCDVSGLTGSGEIRLASTSILAGGTLTLIQAILG